MTPEIKKELEQEDVSEFHKKLLDDCLAKVKRSRGEMSKKYPDWDLQDQVYRGERQLDEDDIKQLEREKPVKMIVPNTFAQVMTFTSFLFLMFKQNNKFFELSPTGAEDFGTKWRDCEGVLDRDWRRSTGNVVLFQHLLDIARFGTAPLEVTWTKESTRVFVVPEPRMVELNGVPVKVAVPGTYETFTKFEGNRIRNVSPYRWFPDVSFPLSEFHRGDFCASEEDFTMGGLRALEANGEVAGVEHIQGLPRNWSDMRGGPSRMSFTVPDSFDPHADSSPVVVTKMRIRIVPSKFELQPGKFLGKEDFPVLYTVWYANDNRIIRCEPSGEWHNELGYAVGQFTPDMHQMITLGLADLVYRLQDVISWFVNSHITSVRRVIQNRNVINPAFVETKSYDGEGDIFIRKGVGRIDPRMAVSQLPAADVTGQHMNDVDVLGKLMQMVTGVNDNAMGQYNSGRRSASEARVVTAGAAGRMKMHGHLIWDASLGRIGKMMLSNSRQSLSLESFAWALGGGADPNMLAERFQAFKGNPAEIVCGDDYLVFDSTLSSEKGFMAQNLQELLGLILQSDPTAAQRLAQEVNPVKLVAEMQYLRDGTPIERLRYSPEEQQQIMMQQQMAQQAEQQAQQQQMEMAAAQGQQQMMQSEAQHRQKLSQASESHRQKLSQAKANGSKSS